jgi:hypothetical protein
MRLSNTTPGYTSIAVCALVVGLLGAGTASARNAGIASTALCSSCHGNAAFNVSVFIEGPTVLSFGQAANYTIEIVENVSGALQAGAGLNVTAFVDGAFDTSTLSTDGLDADILKLLSGQLTHVAARTLSAGVFSYEFSVTAPSETVDLEPLELELRGAMNSFNANFNAAGDFWNRKSLFITVPEPGRHGLAAAALLSLAALRRRRAC